MSFGYNNMMCKMTIVDLCILLHKFAAKETRRTNDTMIMSLAVVIIIFITIIIIIMDNNDNNNGDADNGAGSGQDIILTGIGFV